MPHGGDFTGVRGSLKFVSVGLQQAKLALTQAISEKGPVSNDATFTLLLERAKTQCVSGKEVDYINKLAAEVANYQSEPLEAGREPSQGYKAQRATIEALLASDDNSGSGGGGARFGPRRGHHRSTSAAGEYMVVDGGEPPPPPDSVQLVFESLSNGSGSHHSGSGSQNLAGTVATMVAAVASITSNTGSLDATMTAVAAAVSSTTSSRVGSDGYMDVALQQAGTPPRIPTPTILPQNAGGVDPTPPGTPPRIPMPALLPQNAGGVDLTANDRTAFISGMQTDRNYDLSCLRRSWQTVTALLRDLRGRGNGLPSPGGYQLLDAPPKSFYKRYWPVIFVLILAICVGLMFLFVWLGTRGGTQDKGLCGPMHSLLEGVFRCVGQNCSKADFQAICDENRLVEDNRYFVDQPFKRTCPAAMPDNMTVACPYVKPDPATPVRIVVAGALDCLVEDGSGFTGCSNV